MLNLMPLLARSGIPRPGESIPWLDQMSNITGGRRAVLARRQHRAGPTSRPEHPEAAVVDQERASQVRGVLAGQEHDQRDAVLGRGHLAQRRRAEHLLTAASP